MKRILLGALASALLALSLPTVASAHHRRHHHLRRHAHHARVLTFKAAAAPTTPTTPTAPTTTPISPEESVGTITKFENGVLTITLNDGTEVSGKVTENTEIRCPSTGQNEQGDDDGGDGSGGGDEHSSTMAHDSCAGEDGSQEGCTTAALVAGAKVGEAELVLTGSGAVWEKVILVA